MTSIFPNSQNVVVTGGQFFGNTTRIEGSHDGLDQLRHHTALGALLDSTERFDPPKCAPDTRNVINKQILDWVSDPEEAPSVMWLHGPAGAGKSAIAQTVAEILRGQKRLMASFFFSRSTADRSDGKLLIPTLSYQLLLSLPATRRTIKQCIESDPTVLNRASDTQMKRLFVEPINQYALSWLNILSKWTEKYIGWCPTYQPRLVVVDGLDECQNPRIQRGLLKAIGESTKHLQYPVRFLVSCRPESHIIRVFKYDPTFQQLSIPTINLALDINADRDIQLFIQREFNEIKRTHPLRSYLGKSWPGPDVVSELVQKASGQFIYASTVTRYIQSPKHRPDDRLDVVLGLSPPPSHESPFSQLDALYTHIFASVLEHIDIVIKIFGALIEYGNFPSPKVLEEVLFLKPGDILLNLEGLQSVVTVGGPDSPIMLLHASLVEYLLDPSRSGRYHVDPCLAQTHLARGHLAKISKLISSHNSSLAALRPVLMRFITQFRGAYLTNELHDDIIRFNFTSIWKIFIARHTNWLVLNPFTLWDFFFSVFEAVKNFRGAKRLHTHFASQIDELNGYLIKQLKGAAIDNYITGIPSAMRWAYSNIKLDVSFATTQYLYSLCELFSWDYNGVYTPNVHIRYAHAVTQCLKFIQDKEDRISRFPRPIDYPHFNSESSIFVGLDGVHLDCAIALLPHACYDLFLVDFMKTYNFSAWISEVYPDKMAILSDQIKIYLQTWDRPDSRK